MLQPAILNLGRLNNFRLNAVPAALARARDSHLAITLAGVDVRTRIAGLTIRDVLNDAPNTCTLTIDGVERPTPLQALRILLGVGPPRLLFNGALDRVDLSYRQRPGNTLYPCSAVDDTTQANRRRPFGTWTNISATQVARDVLAQAAPGFTTNHVQASLPAVSVILDGTEGVSGALKQIAQLVGGYFYFEDTDLHLFIVEATDVPDPIDDTPGRFLNDPPITQSLDTSQLRTRQCGKGHGEAALADVAALDSIVPIADAVMFNPLGGLAITLSQRFRYTGVQLGGGGSLVGPGAGPSVAPNATAVGGAGLPSGTYQYAYTHVTAAGESIPSPLASVTTGGTSSTTLSAPTPAPSAANNGAWNANGVWSIGDSLKVALTYVTATGETVAGGFSNVVVAQDIRDYGWPGTSMPTALDVTGIPVGPAGVTGKRLYVYRNGASLGYFALSASATEALHLAAPDYHWYTPPTSGTATVPAAPLNQVAIAGLALGPAGTTSRKLYRTAVNGSQLKLLTTIADNTTTALAGNDTTADASLGANAPTIDTSGLGGSAVAGTVLAGSTVLPTSSAAPFNRSGALTRPAMPGLTVLTGAGIDTGVHAWAVTFVTAAGETLPSDLISCVLGPVPAPTSAPTVGTPTGTSGLAAGTYDYVVGFLTAAGETTPGPASAPITIAPVGVTAPATPALVSNGPNSNATSRPYGHTVGYCTTFVTASGESLPSAVVYVTTVQCTQGTYESSAITLRLYHSSNARVTGINLYSNTDGGPFYLTYVNLLNDSTASHTHTDSGPTISSGPQPPTVDGTLATPGTVPITLPLGPAAILGADPITGRVLYRRLNSAGTYKRVATIGDNTTTAYTDTTPTASLGPAAPSTSTAGTHNRVTLTAIALGTAGVIGRKLYRTGAGGGALKLLATLADNSTTTYTDTLADASLGATAPSVDTSGGLAVLGGWARIAGGQAVRYTGVSGNNLTGIPASGPGALQTTVRYGDPVLPAPTLTGVTGNSAPIKNGDPVNIWVQRDDLAAQAQQAAVDAANGLTPADGIYEGAPMVDERRGEPSLIALCDAMLKLYARPIVTVTYACRDPKTKSGKPQYFNVTTPRIGPFTLTIQEVTIDQIGTARGTLPRFTVTASSLRQSLDDVLRELIAAQQAAP